MNHTVAQTFPWLGPREGARAAWERVLEWIGLGILALTLFNFPRPTEEGLDPSWRMALTQFFQQHRHFGTEVVFTYGPFGFATARTYSEVGWGAMLIWQVFACITFTWIVAYTFRNCAALARWTAYFYFAVLGSLVEEPLYIMMIALLGWNLIRDAERSSAVREIFSAAILGMLSLVKFTNFMMAVAVIMSVIAVDIAEKRPARALRLPGFLAAAFLLGWIVAHQPIQNIPAYLLHSWQISAGYQQAMAAGEALQLAYVGGCAVIFTGICAGLLMISARHRAPAFGHAVVLLAFVYLSWKHGFTRADPAHLPGFFTAMVLPAIVFPAFVRSFDAPRPGLCYALLLVSAAVSVAGLVWERHNALPFRYYIKQGLQEHTRTNLERLLALQSSRHWYENNYVRHAEAAALPEIRRTVGRESVDVLGHEQHAVIFNGLNYQPRPVFQSYSAYTAALAELNRKFFDSPDAPTFLLQKIQSIDERLPMSEDATVLVSLPQHYTFVLEENGFALWRKRHDANTGEEAPRLIEHRPVTFGQAIGLDEAVGASDLWIQLRAPLSILGRLRAMLFRTPAIQLVVEDEAGTRSVWRVPLPLGELGFIGNPLITDLSGYRAYASGKPARRVRSFTLLPYPGEEPYFKPGAEITLSRISPRF